MEKINWDEKLVPMDRKKRDSIGKSLLRNTIQECPDRGIFIFGITALDVWSLATKWEVVFADEGLTLNAIINTIRLQKMKGE